MTQMRDPTATDTEDVTSSHAYVTLPNTATSDATWQRFLQRKEEEYDAVRDIDEHPIDTHDDMTCTDPSHALAGATIEIPSWMEVTVSHRTVVHFSVRVTSTQHSFTVWRKHRDFQQLHESMTHTLQAHPQHGIRLPSFPTRQKRTTLEPWRAALEKYMSHVMSHHVLWDDVASFVAIDEQQQQQQEEVVTIQHVTTEMNAPQAVPGYEWTILGVSVTGWYVQMHMSVCTNAWHVCACLLPCLICTLICTSCACSHVDVCVYMYSCLSDVHTSHVGRNGWTTHKHHHIKHSRRLLV